MGVSQDVRLQGMVESVNAPTSSNKPQRRRDRQFDTNMEIQTEWGTTPSSIEPDDAAKFKPKTRGDVLSIDQELEDLGIADNDKDAQQLHEKVSVKKPTFEILTSLFARQRPKGVLWDKFVDAMAKVGFMSRRSGGSAVIFEPDGESKWYGQGSIVFHRPHPDSTIDPVMLGSIGKRMKKWFGWGSETFELGK